MTDHDTAGLDRCLTVARLEQGKEYGHTFGLATTAIKSTYSLDAESLRALEDLARRWRVSKSEALRRAIRSEARPQPARGGDPLAALDELQASLRSRNVDLEQWAREVESGRWATGRRRAPKPR